MCDACEKLNTVAELEIKHGGCTIGTICVDCLKNIEGVQLHLKKNELNNFEIYHVSLLDKLL